MNNTNAKSYEKIHKYKIDNSWKNEIDEFSDNIINNKPIMNGNSKDALAVMKLIYMIYKSDKKWKTQFKL